MHAAKFPAQDLRTVGGTGGNSRAQSEPLEAYRTQTCRNLDVSRPKIQTLNNDLSTAGQLQSDATNHEFSDKIRALTLALQQANIGREYKDFLSSASFITGRDSLLHREASVGGVSILSCVIDHVRHNNLDIDAPNHAGHSALELAVRANRIAHAKLLLQGGASVDKPVEDGNLLHHVIFAGPSVEMSKLLLAYGADVEGEQHQNLDCPACPHTPLHLAWNRFWACSDQALRERLCSIVEVLLEHGARCDWHGSCDRASALQFVHGLKLWQKITSRSGPKANFSLWHFLGQQCSPLCWFPRRYCPSGECDRLASYIFHHTAGSGLSTKSINCTDLTKHCDDLEHLLMSSHAHPDTSELRLARQNLQDCLQPAVRVAYVDCPHNTSRANTPASIYSVQAKSACQITPTV